MKYINEYREYLIDNTYSNTSITSYIIAINIFNTYLDKNKIDVNILSNSNINEFINTSINDLKLSTQKTYLSGVKNYLYYLIKYQNFTFDFDQRDIKQIKQNKKDKKIIDSEEIHKEIEKIKFINKRDYLIMLIITKTGMRITELVKIKKNNIFNNKIIIENSEYFIDKPLYILIKDYQNNEINKSIYLLIPFSKNNQNNNNLTTRSIEMIIKKYFNDYSYNDLKSIYYKSLINTLPNINQIFKHSINNIIINLSEINHII